MAPQTGIQGSKGDREGWTQRMTDGYMTFDCVKTDSEVIFTEVKHGNGATVDSYNFFTGIDFLKIQVCPVVCFASLYKSMFKK